LSSAAARTELGGGAWRSGEKERFRFVRRQTGEPGAIASDQLVAARWAAIAINRDAGFG
jgi:hypothetical protein